MTNVATYYNISDNVPEDQHFFAYIILPSGDFWHVRFNGSTEEVAREKAISRWTKENAKWERLGLNKAPDIIENYKHDDEVPLDGEPLATKDPWAVPSGRGHHFAGKVWMRHATEGLKRVALTEIALYEKNGFVRGKKA